MIAAITLLRRKPGLSPAEFQAYWRRQHAAVIEALPGIERYTQSHPLDARTAAPAADWDGVAELWARDSQVFRDIGTSDAYQRVLQDEENFLDRGATALVLTEARPVLESANADGAIRYIRFFKRRPDASPQDFQFRWLEVYGPLLAALPGLRRYVQYPARLGGYKGGREPLYDGFDVTCFDDADSLRAAFASPTGKAARAAETGFLAGGEAPGIIARELRLIG
ncbi:MAG: EthD family reductase [Gammaproteobacteria bacterium]|nr:EthD family reductase [Gammaproteobacteria bacterium]MDH4255388.1 EthD family reductase [Gammaproteobacteria bacterium]MDH5312061.1 EthD family reductase [Gammaproteobacteria bacterium]